MTATISGNSFPTPQTSPAEIIAADSTKTSTKTLNQNFDQFLALLTTQLKNQDPLSPMDSTQFTNQLVSFSQVEQQIKVNDNLSKLITLNKSAQTTLGLSFIGLNIDMPGSAFDYSGSGDVKMSYKLASAANTVTVKVVDENGNTVYTQSGETSMGNNKFIWNGKNQAGQPVPSGSYQVRVVALDNTDKPIGVTTSVPGFVTGISTNDDGTTNLIVGKDGTTVPLSQVSRASL